MISNDEVQSALITYIKSKPAVTGALLAGEAEIREDQWQGDVFTYPCVRLRLISNVPLGATKECSVARVRMSWMVFSESSNSAEADRIAGVIYEELHRKQFVSNSIQFYLRGVDLIPAARINERTWRSEVLMDGTIGG